MTRLGSRRGSRDAGFSLVEVLVCVAIVSTALVVIVSAARREAIAGRAVLRAREARAALEEAVDAFQFGGAEFEGSLWARGGGQYRVSWTQIPDRDEGDEEAPELTDGASGVDSSTAASRPWVDRREFQVRWTDRGREHSLSRVAWRYSAASRPRARRRTRWSRRHARPGAILIEVLLALGLGSLVLVTVHLGLRRVMALRSALHESVSRGDAFSLRDRFSADLARTRTILSTNPVHGLRSTSLTLVLVGSGGDGESVRRAVWEMDGKSPWLTRKEERGDGDRVSKILRAGSVWFEVLSREKDAGSVASAIRVCVEGTQTNATEVASAETLNFFLPIPLPVRSSGWAEP